MITHVLIIEGPPKYAHETAPFHGRIFKADNLPDDFAIKSTYGDAFLTYKDDGTIATVCTRRFLIQREDGCYTVWPLCLGWFAGLADALLELRAEKPL